MTDARTASVRATVAKFLEDRIKDLRKQIATDVMEHLDAGDRKSATLPGGAAIGTVSVRNGTTRTVVHDGDAYKAWVAKNAAHQIEEIPPTEARTVVRSAYTKSLTDTSRVIDGLFVHDKTGEVIPGIRQDIGEPGVTVRISDEQLDALFDALASGDLAEVVADVLNGNQIEIES